MKLSREELNEIFFEGEVKTGEGIKLEIVEEGDFEQDYKTQSAEIIFTDGEFNYCEYVYRSGSPFTDWEYDEWMPVDPVKVEKVEVITTEWAPIKEG